MSTGFLIFLQKIGKIFFPKTSSLSPFAFYLSFVLFVLLGSFFVEEQFTIGMKAAADLFRCSTVVHPLEMSKENALALQWADAV